MPENAPSIRQNLVTSGEPAMPDFRRIAMLLRIVLAAHVLALLTVAIAEPQPIAWPHGAYDIGKILEPALLLSCSVLALFAPRLRELPAWQGWLCAVVVADLAALLTYGAGAHGTALWRVLWWATTAVAAIGAWLHLTLQRHSPALDEARLMALSARIRPHFLFNSLNGILGIMRSDTRRAERALEELAELFRALMQDPRHLVPLSEEIALCRQYIELERLRLGERVRVTWDIERCPPDALMPPLMLQPLIENAVYHGIEPAAEPGIIDIRLLHSGSSIVIAMSNPNDATSARAPGNQMALANIRERLQLFYGQAASLDSEAGGGRYTVRIVVPYQRRAT